MDTKVQDLSIAEFQSLISNTIRETMENIIEDMFALSSDKYIRSIKEARSDYQQGRVKNLEDVFDV